jgi:hypothetical protein
MKGFPGNIAGNYFSKVVRVAPKGIQENAYSK